ncbi:MAG: orotate phosphoribosyltransferase [Bacteroidales bacterium]|nr:orotate phosphoribosyltransferase [Bacteroidales bacterium]
MKNKQRIAELLLQSKAIKLEPAKPFTWASGWKSPIYCDNRKTLSYPEIRTAIRDAYVDCITGHFSDTEVIAGVATGAIAQGALVAESLNLPFIYVRSQSKGHGTRSQIEGVFEKGQKVVVIEDLISTGGSSLKAVEAIRNAGCNVLGMVAAFTYGFPASEKSFEKANLVVHTLTDYDSMLQQAVEIGYIDKVMLPLLKKWRIDPANWSEDKK